MTKITKFNRLSDTLNVVVFKMKSPGHVTVSKDQQIRMRGQLSTSCLEGREGSAIKALYWLLANAYS